MSVEQKGPLSRETIEALVVRGAPKFGGGSNAYVHPYLDDREMSRLPLGFAVARGLEPPVKAAAVDFPPFGADLRPAQLEVAKKALDLLNEKFAVLLSTHVGFGKTIVALYLMCASSRKTCIVVNRLILINQWKDAIGKYIPGVRVNIVDPKKPFDAEAADIFIVNAINVPKIAAGAFSPIGLLIVDEVHLILSAVLCKSLLRFTPEYLIGLSATPYRADGSDSIFTLFFGTDTMIYRPLRRAHTVKMVSTAFVPVLKKTRAARVDWGDVLEQQALDEERNLIVVDIVRRHPALNFMILCRRVTQIDRLADLFARANIVVEAVHGSRTVAGVSGRRALIGTTQKLGVGFDDQSLTALIIAADVQEYFIQYLGRVFRDPQISPVIFDIVDVKCFLLYKHYKVREAEYLKSGGTIAPPA